MEEDLTYSCENAIVIIVFNRPSKTKELLDVLRKVRPSRLYVIADGPRDHKLEDQQKCKEVRSLIDSEVTWDCKVKKIYSEKNLSGPIRVPLGFNEVFSIEKQAIILEDDCIPDLSFFKFCDILLDKYAENERVGTICGTNLEYNFFGRPIDGRRNEDYFFSTFPASWGWATWKSVWDKFEVTLEGFPEFLLKNRSISNQNSVHAYWTNKFMDLHTQKINNWDYKLSFTLISNNLLSVIPNINMISNIGFDEESTHFQKSEYFAKRRSNSTDFPLVHPKTIVADERYDRNVGVHFFTNNKVLKVLRYLRNLIN